MLVHSLIKAFVRQSGTLAASRPSDNSLASGAQPPLAWFACNGSNLSSHCAARTFWLAPVSRPLSALLLAYVFPSIHYCRQPFESLSWAAVELPHLMASRRRGMTVYGRLLGSPASTRVEGDWEEASNSCEKSFGRLFETARALQTSDTAKGANAEEARNELQLCSEHLLTAERSLLTLRLPQETSDHFIEVFEAPFLPLPILPSSKLDSSSLFLNTEDWGTTERKLLFLLAQLHAIHFTILFLHTCDWKESVRDHAL